MRIFCFGGGVQGATALGMPIKLLNFIGMKTTTFLTFVGEQCGKAEEAMGVHFLTLADGKGRIDVAHVIALGNAVKVEVEGIEFGA